MLYCPLERQNKIHSLGVRGLPRITRAPPRGQEDEFLDFASFRHRGGDNTVDGVVFMWVGYHFTLSVLEHIYYVQL